jgi:hypothetical protein
MVLAGHQGLQEEDPRRKLVRDILASRTFAKSNRLSSFLEYICRCALQGKVHEINEQEIGVHVFGRSPSYNPNDDGIVRTHARLLRQRLEEYFEHESPHSPLILLIPKGGYVPVFEKNLPQPAVEPDKERLAAPEPATASATVAPPRKRHWVWIVWSLLFVLLCIDIGLRRFSEPRSAGYAHEPLSAVFDDTRPTVIVSSDDALVLFQELTKSPVSLDDYLSGSYLDKKSLPQGSIAITADWINSHQYTSIADLSLALRLEKLPEAARGKTETRFARDLRIDDIKNKNIILIGGIGANPWVGLYENQLNFDVNYNWKTSEGYVLNKKPRAGELTLYKEVTDNGIRHNYGVLAFLPGIDGNEETLLFEGTGMAGTESAAEFLFDRNAFDGFIKQVNPRGNKLPHFEALLETASIGGNAPQAKIVTFRILP